MKKTIYLAMVISLLIAPLSAAEKKDCSGLKKFSKAFISCKSGNLKTSIINTGSKIKKNTINKNKKGKQVEKSKFIITPTTIIKKKNSNSVKVSTTNKKEKINKKGMMKLKKITDKIFAASTKQYPKGVK